MNGHAAKHFVADCAIASCHWTSEPLSSPEAAIESRRAHLNGHAHADLVDHVATNSSNPAEYERSTGAGQ